MDEFLTEMAEIVDEPAVKPSDTLEAFEAWDSLAELSVLAMADARFGVRLTAQDLRRAVTVEDVYGLIAAKKAA